MDEQRAKMDEAIKKLDSWPKYSFRKDVDRLRDGIQHLLHDDFFFVNIGANDGVTGDPIYPLARQYGWSGILVEPVPYLFEKLQRNYEGMKGIIFENIAISDEPRSFWYVEEHPDSLAHMVSQMGSLSREHLQESLNGAKFFAATQPRKGHFVEEFPPAVVIEYGDEVGIAPDADEYIRSVEVECLTFTNLMDRHGVTQVDFLNIDAEGFDHEVFKQIDFERFLPKVLCIEMSNFPEGELEPCKAQIDELGYSLVGSFGLFSRVFVQPA